MKAKDVLAVALSVEHEGFDYTFAKYSNFDEIRDAEFHKLRNAFLDAREKLIEYVGLEV